ncbi:ATP-dependent RNA helicase A-like, partial [Penaeus japonicus]|uniref:ATP-dependent RNA helicase A-like n=1 Tax=Penaeus japonicus TaxID=27405 RepID=UPI001C716F61
LLISAFVTLAGAAPGRYGPPPASGGGSGYGGGGCNAGEILHVDGSCVVPIISRNVFVYDAPEQPEEESDQSQNIPPPRVNHNIVFVRVPGKGAAPEPIVVPPPRQQNIVYVLNKDDGGGGQQVIEVPAPPPSNPEVYFVNYAEGDNPQLPSGVDLQTALQAAANGGGAGNGASGGFGTGSGGGSGSGFGNGFGGSSGNGFSGSGGGSPGRIYGPP